MKQWSVKFDDRNQLAAFVEKHRIDRFENVFVQVASGCGDRAKVQKALHAVRGALPGAVIAGMGSMVQFAGGELLQKSVTLSITAFEKSRTTLLEHRCKEGTEEDSDAIVHRLLESMEDETKGILLLTNAVSVNVEELIKKIRERIALPVFGGIATVSCPDEPPQVIAGTRVYEEDAVVAVLFHGRDLILNIDHFFGWDAIGREYTVTEAKGRYLLKLDGLPLMDVYTNYFGPMTPSKLLSFAMDHPLIKRSRVFGEVSRVLLKFDGSGGLYTGEFEVGEKVQIGFGNYRKMVDCILNTPRAYGKLPVQAHWIYMCISYTSEGFSELLGKSLELFRNDPDAVHLYVTFGEFGFVHGKNSLLNNVVVKVFLSEDPEARYPFGEVDLGLDEKDYLLQNLATLVVTSSHEIMDLNHHLEEEVRLRTAELEELNRWLAKRVEQEVKKNRDKEKILYHQSKLAAMGEMLNSIAHQWRQPLNIIALVMEDLYLRSENGNLGAETILLAEKKINDTLKYLSDTIDDFRSFASRGDDYTETGRFPVVRAIREAVRLLGVILEEEGVRLELELPETEVYLPGRSNDLKHVLLNLVYNALDVFRERQVENRVVRISLQEGSEVVVAVRDNGGGIDEKMIGKVFEPDFTTKYHARGSGLGLYMTRMIVETRLFGRIEVKNRRNGTLFLIRVPRHDGAGRALKSSGEDRTVPAE